MREPCSLTPKIHMAQAPLASQTPPLLAGSNSPTPERLGNGKALRHREQFRWRDVT